MVPLLLTLYTNYYHIIVQAGNLDQVSNLTREDSNITWLPPFSLNLTNIEPDIIYCVEVFNITCDKQRELVINVCHVTEPRYQNIILSPQLTYNIVITPRSNFVGSVNGSRLETIGN